MSGTIEVPENWICNKKSHDFYTYLAHRMDGWMAGWLSLRISLCDNLSFDCEGPYLGGKVCCERTKEATSFPRDGPAGLNCS